MAKKKTAKKAVVKKKWAQILAPKMFNSQSIGETYVQELNEGIGKNVTVNLMTLTKNPKNQGVNVSFVVTGSSDGKLFSEFTGFKVMHPVMRRIVRRGRDKIEDSFECITSDRKKVRMKPVVVTRTKASGLSLTNLRKKIREHLVKTALSTTYENLASDIIERKLQKGLIDAISKIFPISACEMKWFLLHKDSRGIKPSEEESVAEDSEKEEKDNAKTGN